ncbi:hypothetical protein BH24DEI2_BH24DEI2_10860 [soil metagenome]
MPTLYESLVWTRLPLTGTPASPGLHLAVGAVGEGTPSALLIAGTHGDEGPWSALAIRAVLEHPLSTLAGRLQVVFTANPLAAQAVTRNAPVDSPNGVDLDGCFPGNPEGSHTERIAAHLAPIVADSDLVLDLHGGGSWCVNAFTKRFPGSEALVEQMGADCFRDVPDKPGGLTAWAKAHGAKAINVEVGGRGKNEKLWTDEIRAGLERILHAEGVLRLEPAPAPAPAGVATGPTSAIRSTAAGIFVPEVGEDEVGTVVAGGTVLGRVLDLHTLEEREVIRAPFTQTALLLLRAHTSVVEGGAILYALAEPEAGA